MVGVVRDIVIPIKGGTDPVFTIVCEILTTPTSTYHQDVDSSQDTTKLWKMASAWRVISFFLVVFVLPTVLISLPLYARYHLYHARHLPMTETDTRALNHAVSSFWCQGQRVTSNGTLDAFLVAGSPQVQKKKRHVTLRRNLTLQHDDIEYWGVYLLEGSSFSLSTAARWPGGTLLVVRGEENLRKCFYRENSLQEQLNGGLSPVVPNVYQGIHDEEIDKVNDDDINFKSNVDNTRIEFEEDGGQGGEVFDDEENERVLSIHHPKAKIHKLDELEEKQELLPLRKDVDLEFPKNDLSEKKPKHKGERKKKNKKVKESQNERLNGGKRSLFLDRVRRDAPFSPNSAPAVDESTQKILDNLQILHKFNDTIDVTTGNSSFSSSEEFLEQCRNTILTIDVTPFPDWHVRILNSKSENQISWQFTINATDYYYFIFTSDNSIELNYLGFNLELERATYDVSAPLDSCQNSTECVFPLAFTQTESVIVEVPAGENLHELHSFEVTTTCQPRVPVYMVFILLVPFIILLFAFQ
ncbi:Peptidyl-prolyl isomerase cwc27 [Halocaridina rubra]|uniref:Peptidyl-prolyl isomerase cwc27 n=1 Tax=Halocaridina rubra TaxID=373956 RepID=A0AAN8XHT8_HALRR